MANGNRLGESGTFVDGWIDQDKIEDPEHRRELASAETNDTQLTGAKDWVDALAEKGHPITEEIARIRAEVLGEPVVEPTTADQTTEPVPEWKTRVARAEEYLREIALAAKAAGEIFEPATYSNLMPDGHTVSEQELWLRQQAPTVLLTPLLPEGSTPENFDYESLSFGHSKEEG